MLGTWIIFWIPTATLSFLKPKAYDKTCDFSRRFLSKWVRSSRGRIRKKNSPTARRFFDVGCLSRGGGSLIGLTSV